jgi:hypothetical protein
VTYGSFVVGIKDHKEEKERTRLTVGGDQIEYPGDKSTRTAGLTTAKILINSVISTLGAKFLVIDIKIFYLNTPLGRFEYMVINLSSLPQETIDKYDLIELSQDGKVYIEIQKGMYGLPQAGILANELVQRNLAKDGYRPTTHTHGLWTQDTRPIPFSLLVDDFREKYVEREHAEHLMACIKKNYNISSDWNGGAYCGLTLDWDYKKRTVDLSMPGYIIAALHKYQHPAPARPEHAPHTWDPPIYGAKTQFVNEETTSPVLSDKDVNKLQQLTGTLLYYARAVDPTLIMPINFLASEQSNATEVTADKVIKLLNHCNTHPETKIRYHASDMTATDLIFQKMKPKADQGGSFTWAATTNRQKTYQRRNFNHQQGSKTCNVVSGRSRIWISFYKRQRRSSPQDNIGGIGAQTGPHTNGNG